jgi:hypothetical protein
MTTPRGLQIGLPWCSPANWTPCLQTVCVGGKDVCQSMIGLASFNVVYPGICRRQDCSSGTQGGLHVAIYPSDLQLLHALLRQRGQL